MYMYIQREDPPGDFPPKQRFSLKVFCTITQIMLYMYNQGCVCVYGVPFRQLKSKVVNLLTDFSHLIAAATHTERERERERETRLVQLCYNVQHYIHVHASMVSLRILFWGGGILNFLLG